MKKLTSITGAGAALLVSLFAVACAAKAAAERLAPPPEQSEQPEQQYQYVPQAPIEKSTMAVAEFDGKNVSQADASIVSDFMRTELVNTAAFTLVEKANMDKLLAEAAFQQTGCSSADCAVKMGKILNVKYMMVGTVSKLLDTYYITVNLVSVETSEIARSFNQEANSARELKEGCRILAAKVAGGNAPEPVQYREDTATHGDAALTEIRRARKRSK